MTPREILVNDRMQQAYRYRLTKPAGRCFHPDFKPELSPRQMLELGVFGRQESCGHGPTAGGPRAR